MYYMPKYPRSACFLFAQARRRSVVILSYKPESPAQGSTTDRKPVRLRCSSIITNLMDETSGSACCPPITAAALSYAPTPKKIGEIQPRASHLGPFYVRARTMLKNRCGCAEIDGGALP